MGQIQSLSDFLGMMRRRLALVVGVMLLGTLASVWWTLRQPVIYEATAVAQIESPAVSDGGVAGGAASNPAEHRLRLLEQQLMARDNLAAFVTRYDLYADTALSPALKVATLRDSVRITQITDPNAPFGAARTPTGMVIAVSDADPETAAAMANDFLAQLVELNRERRAAATQQNVEFFVAEAARVEAEMSALEAQIAAFKEKNARFLPAGLSAQRDELGALKSTLLDLDQRLIELDANRTRLRAEVIERQTRLLEEQQALIRARIDDIEAAIASAPEVERQFGVLNRKLAQLQEQYNVITRRATEAEMGQQLTRQDQFERIEVLESAVVPENPVTGSRKKRVALGAFASALLGIGIAVLLESLNPVIRTPGQLERQLGVKAVIAIPRLDTPADRRRKRLIWVAILAALLALLWAGATAMRGGVAALAGAILRRGPSPG